MQCRRGSRCWKHHTSYRRHAACAGDSSKILGYMKKYSIVRRLRGIMSRTHGGCGSIGLISASTSNMIGLIFVLSPLVNISRENVRDWKNSQGQIAFTSGCLKHQVCTEVIFIIVNNYEDNSWSL